MKIYLKSILSIVLFSILIAGCKKESNLCEMAAEGEAYTLSEAVQSYLSNYTNTNRIIFKTESGEEFAFRTTRFKDTLVSYQFVGACEFDARLPQTIKGTSQVIQQVLINLDEIPNPLFISLLEIPAVSDVKENLVITSGDYFASSRETGSFLFEYTLNDTNPFVTKTDSLALNGRMFYEVIEVGDLSPNPILELKYTKNEGVIFIKNIETNKTYIYDRKE